MKTRIVPLLSLLPLLLGAGDTGQGRAALLLTGALPACADREFLVYRGGGLACDRPAEPKAPVFPACRPQLLTTVRSGDTAEARCAPQVTLSAAELQKITDAETRLGALRREIDAAAATVPATYVGLTSGLVTGDAGGLAAVNARCAAEYAGAALCRLDDLYASVLGGAIKAGAAIPKAWIYLPTWSVPEGAPVSLEGLGDSCAGFTYRAGAQGWTGTAMQWTLQGSAFVLKLHRGAGAACDLGLPLACCR